VIRSRAIRSAAPTRTSRPLPSASRRGSPRWTQAWAWSRAEAIAQIEAEEAARGTRRAVAGFDFTFSIPKAASVVWAVADAGTQAIIADAHHAAVAEVVAFMEREIAATRVGATGRDGAVAQVGVGGLIATAFDHYDSRAGDPHLHTHLVISNKVQTLRDGKWRSLAVLPRQVV